MAERIPLILDTDPALGIWREGRPRDVDDGLAIVEAINAADIELLGVTVTFGNALLPDALGVAENLVRLKQVRVPVIGGATAAMPVAGAVATNPAVAFLASVLEQRKVKIAAIGPLTNLGILLRLRPELASQITEVVVVAGRTAGQRFYLGEVGPVRDFNFECDVLAARVLLESGVPVVMAGFELSRQVVVTDSDLAAIRAKATPSADYLYRNSLDWFGHWTRTFPADAGFHPWDSLAIAWVRAPQLFRTEQRGWRIRDEALTAAEQARNPDGAPAQVPWLETHGDFPGRPITYCTGFVDGAAASFVGAMIDEIY